jgi:hypothetical protein
MTNNKENFVQTLIQKTEKGELKWRDYEESLESDYTIEHPPKPAPSPNFFCGSTANRQKRILQYFSLQKRRQNHY